MRRALAGSLLTLGLLLLLAPAALAHDGGEGLAGHIDDKVITQTGFVIIAAVPLFIALMSTLQWSLDKRKERRKAAQRTRTSGPEWSGGW